MNRINVIRESIVFGIIVALVLLMAAVAVYPQGAADPLYDIGHASLEWSNPWIEKTEAAPTGAWIDANKTFPSSVIYCNEGRGNAIAHTVISPKQIVPFLDFIVQEGNYTCHIDVVTSAGTELKMIETVTFKASWPPHKNTDLKILIIAAGE